MDCRPQDMLMKMRKIFILLQEYVAVIKIRRDL